MRPQFALLSLLGLLSVIVGLAGFASRPALAAQSGTIAGHVFITRPLTKKRVSLSAYSLRGVAVRTAPTSPAVDEMSRVVIYLEGAGLEVASPVTATLVQKNKQFAPSVVIVPVGSTVSFPNLDPIFHNVFSLSKAKSFDLGYYPAGETRLVRFDRPGIVEVYCHIHADMSATILVLPAARWTRPAPDGSFSFDGVLAGSYTLTAWHRSAGFFKRRVTVSGGTSEAVNFTIPVRDRDERATEEADTSR